MLDGCLMVQGSWLKAHGWGGPGPGPGPDRALPSHGPMSHEPSSMPQESSIKYQGIIKVSRYGVGWGGGRKALGMVSSGPSEPGTTCFPGPAFWLGPQRPSPRAWLRRRHRAALCIMGAHGCDGYQWISMDMHGHP